MSSRHTTIRTNMIYLKPTTILTANGGEYAAAATTPTSGRCVEPRAEPKVSATCPGEDQEEREG